MTTTKHDESTCDVCESAALYALGALDREEAEAFAAHLEGGCPVCCEAVTAYEHVVDGLGEIMPKAEPPAALRDRVLTAAAGGVSAGKPSFLAQTVIAHGEDAPWEDFGPGVRIKFLDTDEATGRIVALVRMEPGARVQEHRHVLAEEVFVLEGDCHVAPDTVLRPGDYFRAEAGTLHSYTYSEEGTTFLSMYNNAF